MSSNGRSVRVRGEKREQLDVARFARAVLALYAQLQAEAKVAVEASADPANSPVSGHSEIEKPEANP